MQAAPLSRQLPRPTERRMSNPGFALFDDSRGSRGSTAAWLGELAPEMAVDTLV
jgi:hypothetical protein